jgi:cytochrome c oxidase cbb3-type subunit III
MQRHFMPMEVRNYAVCVFLASLVVMFCSDPALAGARTDPLIGRKLYMTYCYSCHGVTGRGDGPATPRLLPKPRNLTEDAYMSRKTDQDLYSVISGGSPAIHRFSEMPAWKSFLYPERIWDIVAYIRTLHHPTAKIEPPLVRQGNVASGKRIYTDYCAVCHGPEGHGNGPITGMFGPRPLDFTDHAGMAARPDLDLYFAIFSGGEAIGKSTFMPAWGGLLTEQELWDVIAYVRTLSRP